MKTTIPYSIVLGVWLVCFGRVSSADISCKTCLDVADPHDCNVTTTCGKDEVCYAREFTNHQGQQGFRLGCETRATCHPFLNTSPLIGKRVVSDPAPPKQCYACCSLDLCNTALCKGYVVKTATNNTGNASNCPDHFLEFQDNCYLFSSKPRERPEATHFCWGYGANLTSIESQAEQDFVVKEIQALRVPNIYEFWLGGTYEESERAWQWFDGSNFTYTNWQRGQTPMFAPSTHYHHYAMIGNPEWISAYKSAPWMSTARIAANRGVICKM